LLPAVGNKAVNLTVKGVWYLSFNLVDLPALPSVAYFYFSHFLLQTCIYFKHLLTVIAPGHLWLTYSCIY